MIENKFWVPNFKVISNLWHKKYLLNTVSTWRKNEIYRKYCYNVREFIKKNCRFWGKELGIKHWARGEDISSKSVAIFALLFFIYFFIRFEAIGI